MGEVESIHFIFVVVTVGSCRIKCLHFADDLVLPASVFSYVWPSGKKRYHQKDLFICSFIWLS